MVPSRAGGEIDRIFDQTETEFERGFVAYFVSRKMGGRVFVGLKPHAPSGREKQKQIPRFR
jgi:hypothetical protein